MGGILSRSREASCYIWRGGESHVTWPGRSCWTCAAFLYRYGRFFSCKRRCRVRQVPLGRPTFVCSWCPVQLAWYFFANQENCRLYAFDQTANAAGVFWTACSGINVIAEHCKTLERLCTAQASGQELESEVLRVCQSNMGAVSLRVVFVHVFGELVDAYAQSEHGLSVLHTHADVDRNMLHAVARDRSCV